MTTMTIVVLVCGGRKFADRALIETAFDKFLPDGTAYKVVHGAASGADSLAASVARQRGYDVVAYPADWQRFGRSAGPIRNQQMLTEEQPQFVLAFPGSTGTADMIRRATRAGVRVIRVVA